MNPPDLSHFGFTTRGVWGSWAVFGPGHRCEVIGCTSHRYMLGRTWSARGRIATWIMLNPSKADERNDDPTLRKVMGFARRQHCAGVIVVNLFALVATDPTVLARSIRFNDLDHTQGEYNGSIVLSAMLKADLIVAAWGNLPGVAVRDSSAGVRALVAQAKPRCLGLTDRGEPKHPCRLAYSSRLVTFGPAEVGRS